MPLLQNLTRKAMNNNTAASPSVTVNTRPLCKRFMCLGSVILCAAVMAFTGAMTWFTHKHFAEVSRQTLLIVGSMSAETLQNARGLDIPLAEMRGVSNYLNKIEKLHTSISSIRLYDAHGIELYAAGKTNQEQTLYHVSVPLVHNGAIFGELSLAGMRNFLPLRSQLCLKLFCIVFGMIILWCAAVFWMYRHNIQPTLHTLIRVMDRIACGFFQHIVTTKSLFYEGDRLAQSIHQTLMQAHRQYHEIENRALAFCKKYAPHTHVTDMLTIMRETYTFSGALNKDLRAGASEKNSDG